jgi:hypothetical protein
MAQWKRPGTLQRAGIANSWVFLAAAIARLTLAGANLLQDFRRKARHLHKQAVRGHAVIAAGDLADEQLDGFLGPAC